jgi:hypothetical protein
MRHSSGTNFPFDLPGITTHFFWTESYCGSPGVRFMRLSFASTEQSSAPVQTIRSGSGCGCGVEISLRDLDFNLVPIIQSKECGQVRTNTCPR